MSKEIEQRVARLEAENKALKAVLINNRVSGFNEMVEYNLKAAAPAVKDWEIQSFKSTSHDGFVFKKLGDNYGEYENCLFSLESMLNGDDSVSSGSWTIYSVKRLSDGLVITVGDITEQGRITSFQINQSDKMVVYFENGLRMLDFADLIVKPPFSFVTHDGVTITDPEQWVYVYVKLNCIILYKESAKVPKSENCIYFSTESARGEYRINNAKCLSIQEMNTLTVGQLKSLVKSRLNK